MRTMLLLCLLAPFVASSQVTLSTQEQVDNWTDTSVDELVIIGPGINNLDGLSVLTSANEVLIQSTSNLVTLDGLNNLAGEVDVLVFNNTALEDISALSGITFDRLECENNPNLVTVGALNGNSTMELIKINDCPLVDLSEAFTTTTEVSTLELIDSPCNGLNSITTIYTFNYITDEEVTGLSGLLEVAGIISYGRGTINLPSLQTINTLFCQPEAAPQNFEGLPNVESIHTIAFSCCGYENIFDWNYDTNFTGLTSLTSVNEINLEQDGIGVSFVGLEQITTLQNLRIEYIQSDVDFTGLSGLQSIFTSFQLKGMTNSPDFTALESLFFVNNLIATNNWFLEDACNFPDNILVASHTLENNGVDGMGLSNNIENWLNPCDNNQGCTDVEACNYDPNADLEDQSCLFIGDSCSDGNPNTIDDVITDDCECAGTLQVVMGCTYELAMNYNPLANDDDGSCQFANCLQGDLNGDQVIGLEDLLFLLSNFGMEVE